jgi:hypothetical protein
MPGEKLFVVPFHDIEYRQLSSHGMTFTFAEEIDELLGDWKALKEAEKGLNEMTLREEEDLYGWE